MKINKQKRSSRKKCLLVFVAIFIFLLGTLFILEKLKITDFIKLPQSSPNKDATTSKAPSAQSDFSQGSDRTPTAASSNEGSISDNRGSIPSTPPEDQWTVSPSGVITVYSPAKDSVLKNGQSLTGKSTAPKVSFRLVDNVSGVIASGTIDVVNGQFSGTFNFSTTASQGRIDVFTAAADGVESNNIRIPISFGQ